MTKNLSRRALLRAAPAVPVAALPVAFSTPAVAALPDWQAYICDITKGVGPGEQRFLRIAAETVAKRPHKPQPFEPGPIEELLIEYRRRNDILCADGFGEIENHHTDWLDEPLHEALDFMPNSPREFAAMFLLIHLDDIVMADNHAADMFATCESMLA